MRNYLVAVLFIVCGICSAQMLHSEFNYWWSVKSGGGSPPVETNLCFTDTDTSCSVTEEFNEVGTYNGSAIYQGVTDLGFGFRWIYWDNSWSLWVLNVFTAGFGPLDPGFVDGAFPEYFLGSNPADVLDYTENADILCTGDFNVPTGRPLDPCGAAPPVACDFTMDIQSANCSEVEGGYLENGTFNGFPTYELSGGGQWIWYGTQWWIGSSPGIQGGAFGAIDSSDPSIGDWFCSIDLQQMSLLDCNALPDFSIDTAGTLCQSSSNGGDYFEAGVFNGAPYYQTVTGSFVWFDGAGWVVSSIGLGVNDPSGGMFGVGIGIDFCSEYGTLFCAGDNSPVTVDCGFALCVSGATAGSFGDGLDANGGYNEDGLLNGRMSYVNANAYYVFWDGSEWQMNKDKGSFSCVNDDWFSVGGATTPWDSSFAAFCGSGNPAVTQGSCP